MAVYLFGISSVKYYNASTSNYMPASASLVALPDTVKGSVAIDETEGNVTEFFVDQKFAPVKSVKTEEGKISATMQFYDMTFATLAAIKGGTGNVSGYTPATGFSTVEKCLEITTDSGHKINFFNASLITRITGGGGRDKMFAVEMKATPQMTADNAGSWEIKTVW